jgi:hypothetical protein
MTYQQLLDERLVLCTGYKAGKIDETTFEQDITVIALEMQKLARNTKTQH